MWQHAVVPFVRGRGPFASPGGLVTDWDLQTNLPGLFAAGNALYAGNYYHHASVTGRYAGRKAARHARAAAEPVLDQEQIDREMRRVFAPVERGGGMDWKELRAGLCRINAELLRGDQESGAAGPSASPGWTTCGRTWCPRPTPPIPTCSCGPSRT